MKKTVYSSLLLLFMVFGLASTSHAQTFSNLSGHAMNVKYAYQDNSSPCNMVSFHSTTVNALSSWTAPAPPPGHSYYRCDVSSYCHTTFPATMVQLVACGGPPTSFMGTADCGWNVGIVSNSPFDVTVQ